MKIYEKDGAMWAEHEGCTVCAVKENHSRVTRNPLSRKLVFVSARNPYGAIIPDPDIEYLTKRGFPEVDEYHNYHQTLRVLMGKPYGHAGEWERERCENINCHNCCNSLAEYRTLEGTTFEHVENPGRAIWRLCQSCFDRYVTPEPAETPEKRPIDPDEVDATWVGATVECVKPVGVDSYKVGDVFKIRKGHPVENFYFMEGQELAFYIGDFTLIKKAEKKECSCGRDNRLCGACYDEYVEPFHKHNIPKTRTEYTYSALLEFPNGDRVIIPRPQESEGWNSETLWDESEWPHRYFWKNKDKAKIRLLTINHEQGRLINDEYWQRMRAENPRIVSLTKWTREVEEMNRAAEADMQWAEQRETDLVESTWPQRHPSGAVKERE